MNAVSFTNWLEVRIGTTFVAAKVSAVRVLEDVAQKDVEEFTEDDLVEYAIGRAANQTIHALKLYYASRCQLLPNGEKRDRLLALLVGCEALCPTNRKSWRAEIEPLLTEVRASS